MAAIVCFMCLQDAPTSLDIGVLPPPCSGSRRGEAALPNTTPRVAPAVGGKEVSPQR